MDADLTRTEKLAKTALDIAKRIQSDAPRGGPPPDEGLPPASERVVPHALVRGTRGYIEKVVYQINGSYENGWFDASAVMLRRLLETLIIEAFERKSIDHRIKNAAGDFLQLDDLIDAALRENWNLSRNSKRGLRNLKKLGDLAAHCRRFNVRRPDIDNLLGDARVAVEELLYVAQLKQ